MTRSRAEPPPAAFLMADRLAADERARLPNINLLEDGYRDAFVHYIAAHEAFEIDPRAAELARTLGRLEELPKLTPAPGEDLGHFSRRIAEQLANWARQLPMAEVA